VLLLLLQNSLRDHIVERNQLLSALIVLFECIIIIFSIIISSIISIISIRINIQCAICKLPAQKCHYKAHGTTN
jgi:hypothetical protein